MRTGARMIDNRNPISLPIHPPPPPLIDPEEQNLRDPRFHKKILDPELGKPENAYVVTVKRRFLTGIREDQITP